MAIKLSVETSSPALDFFSPFSIVAAKMKMGFVNTFRLNERISEMYFKLCCSSPIAVCAIKLYAVVLFRLGAKLYRYGADRITEKLCAFRESIYYVLKSFNVSTNR